MTVDTSRHLTELEQFIEGGCMLSYYSIESGRSHLVVDDVPLHNVAVDIPFKTLVYGEAFDFGRTGTTHIVHYNRLEHGKTWFRLLKDELLVAYLERMSPEYYPRQWNSYKSTYEVQRHISVTILNRMLDF